MLVDYKSFIVISLLVFIISSVIQIPYVFGRLFIMEAMIIIMIGFIFIQRKINSINLFYFIVICFGIISSIISSIFSGDLYVFNWIFYYICIFCVLNFSYTLNKNNLIFIMVSFLIFHHIFQTIGLLLGVDNFGFGKQGLFYNPNNFGLFSAYAYFISLYLFKLSKYLKFSLFSLIYSLVLVVLSVSRLCLILIFFSSISFFIYYYMYNKGYSRVHTYIFSILILFLISLLFNYGFFDLLLEKSSAVDNIGDVSNGRFDLWIKAISNINMWGNGVDYYKYEEHTAHNNYLHVGVVYGLFILCFFIFSYIYIFLNCFYEFFRKKDFMSFMALISLIFVLIYWCFEVGSSLFIVWFTLLLIGVSKRNRFI